MGGVVQIHYPTTVIKGTKMLVFLMFRTAVMGIKSPVEFCRCPRCRSPISNYAFDRDSASVGKGTSYIMDNAAAKLKKRRMTKYEVRPQPLLSSVSYGVYMYLTLLILGMACRRATLGCRVDNSD